MELIIAILWYMQVIFTGQSYTPDQIDKYIQANEPVIQQIQSNPELSQQVMDQFSKQNQVKIDNSTGSIDVWEEDDEPEPIPN